MPTESKPQPDGPGVQVSCSDKDALLAGLEKYNALCARPRTASEIVVSFTPSSTYEWRVSYGEWYGYGDTIAVAANDAAYKMPTVVKP